MYRRSKAQIISDATCGILMLCSILFFILYGIFAHVWHPTWIVLPCSGLVCGIISIIVNTYTNLQKKEEISENKQASSDKK